MNNWNGFFDVSKLNTATLKQLYTEALAKSTNTHVDVRKDGKIERYPLMSPEEYIETVLTKSTHNVVIDRKAYYYLGDKEGEIASCTLGKDPELFLFIYLSLEDLYELVDKFNISKRL